MSNVREIAEQMLRSFADALVRGETAGGLVIPPNCVGIRVEQNGFVVRAIPIMDIAAGENKMVIDFAKSEQKKNAA